MAAKKKSAAQKASTSSTATPTPARTAKTSDNVLSIEEPQRKQPPQGERAEPTPTIDPTLSSDNRHSTYKDANDKFPADTGNQVEEIPGKPKSER